MGLADKQRDSLLKVKGEPALRLEFDIYNDHVSMWTHFDHNSDFNKAKDLLTAARDHLNEFLQNENMCPFHIINTINDV